MGSELNLWWLDRDTLVSTGARVPTVIPLRLAFLEGGPKAFAAFVRSHTGPRYSSAYGSLFADASRRVLVCYIAEYEVGGARGVLSLLGRVRAAWPGWEVIWAVGGEPHVRRLLTLLPVLSHDEGLASSSMWHDWLRAPGAPHVLSALLADCLQVSAVPTAHGARATVALTLRDCWQDAASMLEGVDDPAGDLHQEFFRDATSANGTDVFCTDAGSTRTGRVPADTRSLLVDPEHIAEVLGSSHGQRLAPVDLAAPHGPPEAIWLDRDRKQLCLLPVPEHLPALIALFRGPAWAGWSIRCLPP